MSYRPGMKSYLLDPRTPPVTANAKDEEWNDRAGMSGTVNGIGAWTAFGTQGFSGSYANGRFIMYINSGNIGGNFVGYAKTQPSTPYTVTCEVAIQMLTPSASSEALAGIGFRDSVSGKMWVAVLNQDFITNVDEYRRTGIGVLRYAATNSITSGTGFQHGLRSVWLQVTNDGANLIAAWSPTGVASTYETILSENYAAALMTPNQFIFGVDARHAGQVIRGQFGPIRVT